MTTHRLRCLRVVQDRLLTLVDVSPRVNLGWRHWGDVADDYFPCIFIDTEEASGPLEYLPTEQITGLFLFGVWAYAKPLGPFADDNEAMESRIETREDLLGDVVTALLADATQKALNDDCLANGESGVTRIDVVGVDTDAGLYEGFGLVRIACAGRFHVTLSSF